MLDCSRFTDVYRYTVFGFVISLIELSIRIFLKAKLLSDVNKFKYCSVTKCDVFYFISFIFFFIWR